MTSSVVPSRYVNESGRSLPSPDFWALVDQYRKAGTRMRGTRDAGMGLSDAWLDPDGTWWRAEGMTDAELADAQARHAHDQWWEAHKRDVTVISGLSDSDLAHFRLGADIRADIPVMNAATDELHRRRIFDYPHAV